MLRTNAWTVALSLIALGATAHASSHPEDTVASLGARARLAADSVADVMNSPEHIPYAALRGADCIALFPGDSDGASMNGLTGLVSCRTTRGWSRASFVEIRGARGGSVLLSDAVFLFVGTRARSAVIGKDFVMGAGVQLRNGPVGDARDTDEGARLAPGIYSYSFSNGLTVDRDYDGTTFHLQRDLNPRFYSDRATSDALLSTVSPSPPAIRGFQDRLDDYSK